MMWGKHKENGVLIGGGRLIYISIGRFRLRLMNPFKRIKHGLEGYGG